MNTLPPAPSLVSSLAVRLRWALPVLMIVALAAANSCTSGKTSYPTGPNPSLELDSGDFGPGAMYRHRFASAGTFAYHCIHHAPMTGSVLVSGSATDTLVTVDIVNSAAAFPAATVRPGGVVVWTNSTGMTHTVTSH